MEESNMVPDVMAVSKSTIQDDGKDKAIEAENVRLGHAIDILNNHMPAFGIKPYQSDDAWKSDDSETIMDKAPEELRGLLMEAMKEAAKYAARCFRSN